jgi:sulfatase maturation enzyme AslB (radical SAM superfamily)
MLDAEILTEYNKVRNTSHKAIFCHAPFTSINFEQNGNATVCCYNRAHVLGSYPQDSIEDMWFGRKAQQLRRALRANVLPAGCQICQDQFQARNFGGLRARFYDHLAREEYLEAEGRFLPMPRVLEFETSNVCNLGCTMCNGFFSSTIRKHREHRPPLKSPYDERFVEQLAGFIPHLAEARFLGGEPFLIALYYRIWELIARLKPDIEVTIVTNGTILNPRVREILDRLKANINISIDSLDPENYQRIRVNARFDQVMENYRFFREYVESKKTSMTFNVCPMKDNWHELPDFLEFCNHHGITLFFNTVIYPEELSLRSMQRGQLTEVIERLSDVPLPETTDLHRSNKANYLDVIQQIQSFRERAFDHADLADFDEEDLTGSDWWLRLDGGNEAALVLPGEESNVVRVAIQKSTRSAPWDIQLNRATVRLESNRRYIVSFRARAERPRPLTFGVARAAEPWDNLGLYKDVSLTPEWQEFQVGFGPTPDAAYARIHFDLGDSDISVEMAAVGLRSQRFDAGSLR